MTLRYHNLEAAALAVAKLRDDGHFARICDESVSSLWGPGAVGGVRVLASDAPIEEEAGSIPDSKGIEDIMQIGRMIVAGLWTFSAIAAGLVILRAAVMAPLGFAIALLVIGLATSVVLLGGGLLALTVHPALAHSVLRSGTKSVFVDSILVLIVIMLLLARAIT